MEDVDDASEEEIAKTLITQWLNKFVSTEAEPPMQLDAYEIQSIESGACVYATYLVKPSQANTYWAINPIPMDSSKIEEGWLKQWGFFVLKKEDDYYGLRGPYTLC